jgi:drug/metabolite transporter (DMT)-like permease
MFIAGTAWGCYSLLGRRSKNPLADTSTNFMLAAPICLAPSLIMIGKMHITAEGILLAVISGVLTTGCAYVIWYKALGGLSAVRASIVQLSVPVLAAFGGTIFLSETITARLVISGVLILGGVALGLGGLSRRSGPA